MSRRIDFEKIRHFGKEHVNDESIERVLTPPGKPRPAWGRAADKRKVEWAQRLVAKGKVAFTKCPPAPRQDCKPKASGLSPEMEAKVAAALAKVAAERKARERRMKGNLS